MPYSAKYVQDFLNLTFAKSTTNLMAPNTVYIGLCTNDPEASGGVVQELSGNGYSRVLISQKGASYPEIMDAVSDREIKNKAQFNWTKATDDWARVKGFFLSSSATVGETSAIFFFGKLDMTEEEEAAGGLLVEKGMIALFDPQAFKVSFPATDSE